MKIVLDRPTDSRATVYFSGGNNIKTSKRILLLQLQKSLPSWCKRFVAVGFAVLYLNHYNLEAQNRKGYREKELVVHSDGWRLYGTLLQPNQLQSPATVVLLIAGSGPTDRNGNSGAMVAPAYLKKLAEALAEKGYASFRYDKRGVGESRDKTLREENLRFDDYVKDAIACIRRLKGISRFQRLVVTGHSEGALVGARAASQEAPDALVVLCGAGFPADSALKRQLRTNPLNRPWLPRAYSLIDSIKAGHRPAAVPRELMALFRPSVQPYLQSWFALDPAQETARLACPVLIVGGSADIQISREDFDRLCNALPQAQCAWIEGMNHVLVQAPREYGANLATYFDPQLPLQPQLVEILHNFIHTLKNP